jgi:Rrf2 family protein
MFARYFRGSQEPNVVHLQQLRVGRPGGPLGHMVTVGVTGTEEQVVRRRSSGGNAVVNISARVDYGIRVLCALAASGGPMTSEQLAAAQGLPHKYLESVLTELRRGSLLVSKRGADGGYRLARPPSDISLADVIRALVGTLAEVRGLRPEGTSYDGPAEHLRAVWLGVRAHLESVLEEVTIDRIVSGDLPDLPGPVAEVVPLRSRRPL